MPEADAETMDGLIEGIINNPTSEAGNESDASLMDDSSPAPSQSKPTPRAEPPPRQVQVDEEHNPSSTPTEKPDHVKSLAEIDKILGTKTVSKEGKDKLNEKKASEKEGKEKGESQDKKVVREEVPPVQSKDPKQQDSQPRELEGFEPAVQTYLKRMPYDAYKYFSGILKEQGRVKELVSAKDAEIASLRKGIPDIPQSYYEHEEAINFLPQVQSVTREITKYKSVADHWEAQLEKVRNGETWQDIEADQRTGEPYISNNREIRTEEDQKKDEKEIIQNLVYAKEQMALLTGKYHEMHGEFKTKHTAYVQNIKNAEDKYLPAFKDPNSPHGRLATKIQKELEVLGYVNNPFLPLLAKSIAANKLLFTTLKRLAEQDKVDNKNEEDQKAAGPSGKELNGSRASVSDLGNKILPYSAIKKFGGI